MVDEVSLRPDLDQLQQSWESLTSPPPHPRSVMNVVEYGLGKQQRAEVYVNRLLRYLLDSNEPHGMDTAFLRAFLEGLPEACEFREDLYDLSNVIVDEQVSIRENLENENDRQGWLDLFIQVPEEWFLLIELKFSAEEKGTEFYCRANDIDGAPVSAYESGSYYLYMHQSNRPKASGECFTNWTWEAFIDDVVVPFLQKEGPRYPHRTVNQLRDLEYDIREISGMSDREQSERDRAELFVEYYDVVSDITDAFESQWSDFTDEWHDRLREQLDDSGVTNEWVFWEYADDWAFIYKNGWWRRVDTFEPISEPVDPDRVRVGFLHRLEQNRDIALGEQTLKFYFRNTPPNRHLKEEDDDIHDEDDERNFRDVFIENFQAREDDIQDALPERASLTGNMHNMIEASYDIPVTEFDTFEEAYLSALQTAFEDHVVENDELVEILDEIYQETLTEFQ